MTYKSRFIEKNNNIIKKHYKLFGGHFGYYVPVGNIFYEINENAYFICDKETPEDLRNILIEDINKGINSVPERYKSKIIVHDTDILI